MDALKVSEESEITAGLMISLALSSGVIGEGEKTADFVTLLSVPSVQGSPTLHCSKRTALEVV